MKVEHANLPEATIIRNVMAGKAFVASPRAFFKGTDAEESAESIIKNLYDGDKLDIGIATELVTLVNMQDNGSDDIAFSILYGALKPKERIRFGTVIQDVLVQGKKVLDEQLKGKKEGSGETADELNYGERDDKTKPTGKKEDQKPVQQPKQQEKREPVKQAPVAAVSQTQQPVDQKASHAAHQLGFNINNFLKQPQPVAGVPPFVPPVTSPVVQQQPQAATPQQQVDQPIPPKSNPMPDADINGKVTELKKHYKFIDGAHQQVNESQIDALLFLLRNSKLKDAVKKHDAKCRPNNIYMVEVAVPEDKKKQYDFAFKISTKDPKKSILVFFNSEQKFRKEARAWGNDMELSVA